LKKPIHLADIKPKNEKKTVFLHEKQIFPFGQYIYFKKIDVSF